MTGYRHTQFKAGWEGRTGGYHAQSKFGWAEKVWAVKSQTSLNGRNDHFLQLQSGFEWERTFGVITIYPEFIQVWMHEGVHSSFDGRGGLANGYVVSNILNKMLIVFLLKLLKFSSYYKDFRFTLCQ